MCSCACALAPAAPSRLSSTHSSSAMRLAPLQAQARLAQQHDGASGGATARRLRTQLGARPALPGSSSCAAGSRRQQSQRGRTPAATRAMVNVDVSPSVVLGVGLIGAGVSLWQIRRVKPWISKDYDVVVSCVSLLVGGILIFQGWRLDPLLLFGQLMTTGAAVSFAIEALRLRSEQYEREEKAELQDVLRRKGPGGSGGSAFQLPPPDAAQQQWAPPPPGQQQAYDYAQSSADPQAGASSSGYGYDAYGQQPAQGQQQWDYGSGPGYQPAQYAAPPADGGAAGGFYGSGGGGVEQAPSEFTFPASYVDPAAGDSSSWGGEAQPPAAPQQQQPPAGGGSSKPYDGMDDW